jgi:hypothetical protein
MNRRRIIALYVVIIVLILVVYFFVQHRFSYEKTHPTAVPAKTSAAATMICA